MRRSKWNQAPKISRFLREKHGIVVLRVTPSAHKPKKNKILVHHQLCYFFERKSKLCCFLVYAMRGRHAIVVLRVTPFAHKQKKKKPLPLSNMFVKDGSPATTVLLLPWIKIVLFFALQIDANGIGHPNFLDCCVRSMGLWHCVLHHSHTSQRKKHYFPNAIAVVQYF